VGEEVKGASGTGSSQGGGKMESEKIKAFGVGKAWEKHGVSGKPETQRGNVEGLARGAPQTSIVHLA